MTESSEISTLNENEINNVSGGGLFEAIYNDIKHFVEGFIDGLSGLPERSV